MKKEEEEEDTNEELTKHTRSPDERIRNLGFWSRNVCIKMFIYFRNHLYRRCLRFIVFLLVPCTPADLLDNYDFNVFRVELMRSQCMHSYHSR